ncbi:single-stranded DNA-binding protein [Lactobacillus helveticus]|uniref:Single-stranded DNA-binding protein n=1 Tax=Lactobacillus helveticus CIRM-BIA 951 TaxID=1226334 RepID=U6F5N5_LACHE|nr:single-stranded DNA-binding protein [Lactobacillus helveticus]MDY0990921.1 single-stranded DNA-binding protein [Lactobacillus helveticus]MDY1001580.1 single-stranded DNA-binding protein [Lactobacillus helveticus]MEB2873442.1 single-stranded DNA-binding protein [Lactobacillus helveticus]CDI58578.1 Single-stranded DNA-binding protein [Lactobacillus helveticus CIRM-BIA 951]
MINRVVLAGRPTKNLELRSTKSGANVCSFTLAVDRNFKNKTGEREADFISCIAWQKTAEVMSKYVKKGSVIGVDGRIQTRSYDNRDGQRVYVTEVIVEDFSFLSGADKDSQVSKNNQLFNQSNDPFDSSEPTGIADDDLPF